MGPSETGAWERASGRVGVRSLFDRSLPVLRGHVRPDAAPGDLPPQDPAIHVLPAQPRDPARSTLEVELAGRRAPLFWLALRTSMLTVLTLGLYRFWMKTRLRRWYWSSVRPGGVPLEYVGEPLEKLLGFLIAVVILAFYLGLANLVLMFASFALFQASFGAYAISFIGVIPVIFYAAYRARRYVLARTRWRGLRLGLKPGAWGYAIRALGQWAMTLLTLGLWWPRMRFTLEKYRIDRTTYGEVTLHQGGDATMLYPAFAQLMTAGILSALFTLVAVTDDNERFLWPLVVTLPWMLWGLAEWRTGAVRLLAVEKSAGSLGVIARPSAGRVMRIWLIGGTLTALGTLLLFSAFGGIVFGIVALVWDRDITEIMSLSQSSQWLAAAIGVIAYFAGFVFFGVLRHVLLTLPLWRHYAETTELTGTAGLTSIRQAARDEFAEAEGFAEALDVGAAI